MELIQGTRKASKFVLEDFISKMPDNVVTNILDRLPLQVAVRTGILSRNWKFKWTMLTQLVFDDNFFEYLLKTKGENNYGRIISRLLLHLKGVIRKFVLYIMDYQTYPVFDDEDINNWILFLSRNGIEDLTLCKVFNGSRLKLATHLFSCLQLKHLKLDYCSFDPPATFHGFPNLLSLELHHVQFESGKFGELCPALEILKITFPFRSKKVKPTEIAKLANLRILSLFLCIIDNTNPCDIFELLGFLPKLQELHLNFGDCKSNYSEDAATKRSPATFHGLKTLKLLEMDLGNAVTLSFAYDMIKSSPNLQTLIITIGEREFDEPRRICFFEVDYNTMRTLQLRRAAFVFFEDSENEICLIKCLLACSPSLKMMVIFAPTLESDEKLIFSTKLLKLHRASPVAEINLY